VAEDLVEDPAAARIFLRALRDFSETCEPPQLHHDCPFSHEISADLRGCGEECMDLLGKYGGPPPSTELTLSNGITVRRSRRPRPRHSAVRESQAYDARAAYLSESERSPRPQWSLQSLLYRFKELIQTPPWQFENATEERNAEIRDIVILLGARGLSLEEHLNSTARFFARMGLFAELIAGRATGVDEHSVIGQWIEFIDREGSKLPEMPSGQSGVGGGAEKLPPFHEIILLGMWSSLAPIEDVLAWVPPTETFEVLASRPKDEFDADAARRASEGRWLIDRFTETYLDRWDDDSLCYEWSFLHGQASPPCSPFELRAREVKLPELSAEMADRLVKKVRRKAKSGREVRRLDVSTSMITSHLVKPAATFLREGRFTEARALFEAILQTDPESADANNNLGFCLLPDNPQLALKYFDETERLTGARGDLLAANRMLALAKLGQVTAVLDIADGAFGLSLSSVQDEAVKLAPGVGSYVWNIPSVLTGASPQLDEVSDLRSYAAEILRAIESSANSGSD
jgi:hypothetical protein